MVIYVYLTNYPKFHKNASVKAEFTKCQLAAYLLNQSLCPNICSINASNLDHCTFPFQASIDRNCWSSLLYPNKAYSVTHITKHANLLNKGNRFITFHSDLCIRPTRYTTTTTTTNIIMTYPLYWKRICAVFVGMFTIVYIHVSTISGQSTSSSLSAPPSGFTPIPQRISLCRRSYIHHK